MTTIKSIQIYSDSSGAPAVVTSGAYTMSLDFLAGEVVLHLLAGPQSHGQGRKKALAHARHAYAAELRARLGDGYDAWIAANVEMYRD